MAPKAQSWYLLYAIPQQFLLFSGFFFSQQSVEANIVEKEQESIPCIIRDIFSWVKKKIVEQFKIVNFLESAQLSEEILS